MQYEGFEDKYDLLPEVSENIVKKLLQEVKNFTTLLKHDPEGAKRSVFQLLSTYVFKLSLKTSLNNALLWFIVSRTSPL